MSKGSTITEGEGEGKRWGNDHGDGGVVGGEREAVSVSHVASNFGSGWSTTSFHHRLLCYKDELTQDRGRERKRERKGGREKGEKELLNLAKTSPHTHTHSIMTRKS